MFSGSILVLYMVLYVVNQRTIPKLRFGAIFSHLQMKVVYGSQAFPHYIIIIIMLPYNDSQ